MRLDGRVVLVTGASSGIGAATARAFAARGAHVLVHGRDPERTTAVARRIGGEALVADLVEPEANDDLAHRAIGVHGRVDVVVANAGAGWSGRFTELGEETAGHLLALDLTAPVLLIRRLLPPMLERGTGQVVVVASVAGRVGVAGEAVYAAAKAGLDVFAESLRFELRGTGIGVTVVIPGVVDTPFFAERGGPPVRRFPRPVPAEAVAEAIVRGVVHDRAEIWVPRWLRVAFVVRALTPGLYARLAGRFGGRVGG